VRTERFHAIAIQIAERRTIHDAMADDRDHVVGMLQHDRHHATGT
jgi:hypothetical protein